MKTSNFYILLLLFCSLHIVAQNRSLPELLSELDKNHMGAVSDVFNETEIQMLRAHLAPTTNQTTENNVNFDILTTETNVGNFGHFNRNSPDLFSKTGPAGAADFEGAGVFNPFNPTEAYIIDNAGNSYLVNIVTGMYQSLGLVQAPNGESFTGLEFNPNTGVLYGISTNGMGSSTLSTIDPITRVVTPIGNPNIVLPIALAFTLNGLCLTYDIDSDVLFLINLSTAVATALGSIGFNADFGQGMGLGADGMVYMSAFNGTTFRSELRMVNTETGATTLVGPIGSSSPGGLLQFAWMSGLFDVLSVSENASNGFTIYPNPVQNYLQIDTAFDSGTIRVYHVSGALVLETNLTQSVDVSSLASGMYLIEIETSDGASSTQKFLKQ